MIPRKSPVDSSDQRKSPVCWQNPPPGQHALDSIVGARLSGQMKIGIGDGAKRVLNPGEILQVGNLTGPGQATRSGCNRVSASLR